MNTFTKGVRAVQTVDEPIHDGRFDFGRVVRSLGLTLIGWFFGALVGGVVFFSPWAFLYMTPYVLGGWLFVILPHVLLVPRRHLLSHPLIAPIYGALWGLGILWFGEYLSLQLHPNGPGAGLVNPLGLATAAITGAVIGLAGSLSHRESTSWYR